MKSKEQAVTLAKILTSHFLVHNDFPTILILVYSFC